MKKKLKQTCENCHYSHQQFLNMVKLPNGENKYPFDKTWDLSVDDPLICKYPDREFPYYFKEVDDDFTCKLFRANSKRKEDVEKFGC